MLTKGINRIDITKQIILIKFTIALRKYQTELVTSMKLKGKCIYMYVCNMNKED